MNVMISVFSKITLGAAVAISALTVAASARWMHALFTVFKEAPADRKDAILDLVVFIYRWSPLLAGAAFLVLSLSGVFYFQTRQRRDFASLCLAGFSLLCLAIDGLAMLHP